MKLLVQREPSENGATLGRLSVDGAFECDTLEDEIREVAGVPTSEWKIYGETAIPQGRYSITLENSPRFGPDTMTVNAVPSFEGIRIHAGNTAKDTRGCLLVGTRTDAGSVGNSRAALATLKAKVAAAINRGEPVDIRYVNP